MKIGIHYSRGAFTQRWISYCQREGINYKLVNAYSSDIISHLFDCDCFMWYIDQGNYKDMLFAKQLIYSLQLSGKRVFPDMNTVWHFDDKLGQKYLFESFDLPIVPTYAFYTKQDAENWIDKVNFPIVFKLRGGAGASNVWLLHDRKEALAKIKKAFHRGFSVYNRWGSLKERIRKYRKGKTNIFDVIKGIVRLVIVPHLARMHGREKGYVYFQDFIPDNQYDVRVIVVGERAFAIKRMNRKNDFRASGSGDIIYDQSQIDERCIEIAFDVNRKICAQSIAFDFVFDRNKNPLIVEISYAFVAEGYDPCEGYWDIGMDWHPGAINPQGWMIEDLIKKE